MKEGWEEKQIGDVSTILNGGTPKTNVPDYWDRDVLWITPKDMGKLTSEYVSDTSRKISELGLQKSSAKLIPVNSIILSTRAPIGHLAINTKEITTNQGCRGIVPDGNLDTRYLYYFCWSSVELFNDLGSGTTFKELSKRALSSVKIPIPPLSEQKEIVAKLDEAFAAIDVAKANIGKNIENAGELFQSRLNEIFSRKGEGWDEKRLGDVCSIESKLVDPAENQYLDMLHIGGGNIISKTGELVDLKTSREEGLKSSKFCFNENMVLYNKIRPYLIKVCVPKFCGLCSADMYPLLPNENLITRDFLYFLLISKKFTDYAILGSARAGMPKVNRKHLFEFQFYLPPIIEQKKFLVTLDELMMSSQSVVTVYEEKIQNLEELKKSLLQKAFAGELT